MPIIRAVILLATICAVASADPKADAFRKRLESQDDPWDGFAVGSCVEVRHTISEPPQEECIRTTLIAREADTNVLEVMTWKVEYDSDGKEMKTVDSLVEKRRPRHRSRVDGHLASLKFVRNDVARVDGKDMACEVFEVKSTRSDNGEWIASWTYWFCPKAPAAGEILRADGIDRNHGYVGSDGKVLMTLDWKWNIESLAATIEVVGKQVSCRYEKSTAAGDVVPQETETWESKEIPGGLARKTSKATTDDREVIEQEEVVAFEAKPEGK